MELLPCPFCGRIPKIIQVVSAGETYHEIRRECECYEYVDHSFSSIEALIDFWNTRAPSDAETRLEEAEKRASIETKCAECYQKGYNAALEEAAQLFDNLVKSSNWNPADLAFFADKIRQRKEG